MKRKTLLIVLFSLVALVLFFTPSNNASFAGAKKPVVIGFIGSVDSDDGKSTLRGAEIAIDELNAAGGILGGQSYNLLSSKK